MPIVTLTNTTSRAISYTSSNVGAGNTLTVSGSNPGTLAGGGWVAARARSRREEHPTKGGAISLATLKAGEDVADVDGRCNAPAGGSATGANVLLRGDALSLRGR